MDEIDEQQDNSQMTEPQYEVHQVLEWRWQEDRMGREFKVWWLGYPQGEATWEPESGLDKARDILDQFLLSKNLPLRVDVPTSFAAAMVPPPPSEGSSQMSCASNSQHILSSAFSQHSDFALPSSVTDQHHEEEEIIDPLLMPDTDNDDGGVLASEQNEYGEEQEEMSIQNVADEFINSDDDDHNEPFIIVRSSQGKPAGRRGRRRGKQISKKPAGQSTSYPRKCPNCDFIAFTASKAAYLQHHLRRCIGDVRISDIYNIDGTLKPDFNLELHLQKNSEINSGSGPRNSIIFNKRIRSPAIRQPSSVFKSPTMNKIMNQMKTKKKSKKSKQNMNATNGSNALMYKVPRVCPYCRYSARSPPLLTYHLKHHHNLMISQVFNRDGTLIKRTDMAVREREMTRSNNHGNLGGRRFSDDTSSTDDHQHQYEHLNFTNFHQHREEDVQQHATATVEIFPTSSASALVRLSAKEEMITEQGDDILTPQFGTANCFEFGNPGTYNPHQMINWAPINPAEARNAESVDNNEPLDGQQEQILEPLMDADDPLNVSMEVNYGVQGNDADGQANALMVDNANNAGVEVEQQNQGNVLAGRQNLVEGVDSSSSVRPNDHVSRVGGMDDGVDGRRNQQQQAHHFRRDFEVKTEICGGQEQEVLVIDDEGPTTGNLQGHNQVPRDEDTTAMGPVTVYKCEFCPEDLFLSLNRYNRHFIEAHRPKVMTLFTQEKAVAPRRQESLFSQPNQYLQQNVHQNRNSSNHREMMMHRHGESSASVVGQNRSLFSGGHRQSDNVSCFSSSSRLSNQSQRLQGAPPAAPSIRSQQQLSVSGQIGCRLNNQTP